MQTAKPTTAGSTEDKAGREQITTVHEALRAHYQGQTDAEKQEVFFTLCNEYYKGNIGYTNLVVLAMAIYPDDVEKKLRGGISVRYRKEEFKKMMSLDIPESSKKELSCMYLSRARGVRKAA